MTIITMTTHRSSGPGKPHTLDASYGKPHSLNMVRGGQWVWCSWIIQMMQLLVACVSEGTMVCLGEWMLYQNFQNGTKGCSQSMPSKSRHNFRFLSHLHVRFILQSKLRCDLPQSLFNPPTKCYMGNKIIGTIEDSGRIPVVPVFSHVVSLFLRVSLHISFIL